jgi:hypothetical protein
MDRDEKLYFDEFSKKSLSEIQEMFQNLKHIGMSDEDIEKYAKQYKEFFESRVKATGFEHIDGKLMERAEIKKTLRDELITEITESNETHQ